MFVLFYLHVIAYCKSCVCIFSGTGKTLIARELGKMLTETEPKVVTGPEILNKNVGQSEENIRKLFKEAIQEQKERGDDSSLHIIIFDEIDSICKQRGSLSTTGTGVYDTVVNQLLSMIDGINALNNVLIIGMYHVYVWKSEPYSIYSMFKITN